MAFKRTRLSMSRVQAICDAWNRNHHLEYPDKSFLQLANDGDHYFLTQIAKGGETGVVSIPTRGTLQHCADLIPYITLLE